MRVLSKRQVLMLHAALIAESGGWVMSRIMRKFIFTVW